MQCFRCGKDLPAGDYRCYACGSELRFGEDYCSQCGTAMLCEECAREVGNAAMAVPASDSAVSSADFTASPSEGLHYEYMTVPVRVHVTRREHESQQSFYDRVHQELVQQTQAAALEGWETADPLDYAWLQQQGLVDRGMLGGLFGGAGTVNIRLKRLVK